MKTVADLEDYELGPEEPLGDEGPSGPRRGPSPIKILLGAVVAVAAVAGLGYFALRNWGAAKRPVVSSIPSPSPTAVATGPSPEVSPIALPPLDSSDSLVRDLAKGLSDDPQLASWLETPGLVRTLTAIAENVVTGENPAPHLGFLAPKQPFTVIQKQGQTFIDAESYKRYDAFANTVASLDAGGCARVYRQIEPLFTLAYRDLGHPEGGFPKTLRAAIDQLAHTPVPEGDVPVRPVIRALLVYELVDPRLEALSPSQKLLLRMGPANARKVQAKLREIGDGLEAAGAD